MKLIQLTKGKAAIIDDCDYDLVSGCDWQFSEGYAKRSKKYDVVYMHRLIMSAESGQEVDHINRNRLDNRRGNLRLCTRFENQHNSGIRKNNTTGYKGVTRSSSRSIRWKVEIYFRGVKRYLGSFGTKEEASRVYKQEAKKLHGDFYYA